MKRCFIVALCALLCFVVGCGGTGLFSSAPEPTPTPKPTPEPSSASEPAPAPKADEPVPDTITGTIEMKDGGVMTFELYPALAPQSVQNFVYLARQGFYDGLTFHRIADLTNKDDYIIQGGCPLGSGTGNPGYSIVGEFEQNGHPNNLSHNRGVLSMARAQDFDSAGSQFFICVGNPVFLDGGYAGFGMITSGMEVADSIVESPNVQPVIKTISIDGNFAFPEPDKLPR